LQGEPQLASYEKVGGGSLLVSGAFIAIFSTAA